MFLFFNITCTKVYKVQMKRVYRKQKYKCVKYNTLYNLKYRESNLLRHIIHYKQTILLYLRQQLFSIVKKY